jgi:endonuclease/exonuclease/phosphatase family metal-dependent hydrolase
MTVAQGSSGALRMFVQRLFLILLLAGCASGTRTADRTLRVMVFNVHAGRDASANGNLERVAALINSNAADLVLLQEVDRRTSRSGGVDQLEVLMRLTHRYGVFGKSLHYQGGEYGIATLSRWPIVAHEIVPLLVDPPQVRAGGAIEPRVALIVDTGALRVVNTHLDASREETVRLQEIDHLLGATKGASLVGGDFNSVPESAVQERVRRSGLRDGWLECGDGIGPTYPADAPIKRIDYLFFMAGFRCTSASVLESTASDHRPLLVTVKMSNAASATRR